LNDGNLIVGSGAELTLSRSTISGANVQVYDRNALNQIVTGTIDVLDTSAIDNSSVNGGGGSTPGALIVESGVTLTLDNTALENLVVENNGTLQVDGNDTLTLSNVNISGGTIDDYTDTSGGVVGATIDVTGDSAITSTIIDGEGGPGGGDGKPGTLTVESHMTLTLDGSTLEGLNVTNNGTLLVEGDTTLTLDNVSIDGGTIHNFTCASGTITAGNIDITGDTTFGDLTVEKGNLTINESTALKIADDTTVTLDGVNVTDNGEFDVGVSSGATLALDDNASISGSGAMTINANSTLDVDSGTTTINLSGTITNNGTLEASCGGTLDIVSHVDNGSGALLATSGGVLHIESAICGGTATIDHGTLEFGAKSDVDVTFHNSNGYGELILDDAADFSGKIFCFTGTDAGLSNSDEIFLTGVQEGDGGLTANYCSADNITTVIIDEQGGGSITLKFVGDYEADNFKVQQDANGLEIYDPPAGGSKHAPSAVTTADDHSGAPANQVAPVNQVAHVIDHATSPSNLFGFGGDQDSAPATSHDSEVAAPADQLALGGKSVIAPLGGGLADSSFADDSGASEPGAGVTIDISTQSLLSSLLKTLTDGTAPAIDLGSGHGQAAIAPALVTTAPSNEHVNEHVSAPTQVTSLPAASPTVASASFGTMGNDSFAFHASLGSNPAQNTDAHTSELAHNNVQISGPALASTAPEFHQDFGFDAIHQDAANLSAAVDQFHQMASNSTLLH
jgi:hypothetical protein